jgi:hypothetical protein
MPSLLLLNTKPSFFALMVEAKEPRITLSGKKRAGISAGQMNMLKNRSTTKGKSQAHLNGNQRNE